MESSLGWWKSFQVLGVKSRFCFMWCVCVDHWHKSQDYSWYFQMLFCQRPLVISGWQFCYLWYVANKSSRDDKSVVRQKINWQQFWLVFKLFCTQKWQNSLDFQRWIFSGFQSFFMILNWVYLRLDCCSDKTRIWALGTCDGIFIDQTMNSRFNDPEINH